MAELDKGKPVSLQELMLANFAQTDALTEVLIEKGRRHGCAVQAEAAGEACGVSAHSKSDNAAIPRYCYVTPAKAHPLRARV
jgi:hypothetical protein